MSDDVARDDAGWRQEFLESIVQNIPNMVFVKDAEQLRFTLFNKAGEELLGLSAEDLLGKNDFDFFPTQEAEFFVNKDREVLASGALLDIPSEPIQTQNQGTRILHTKKIPLVDQDGTPRFLLGISEDITDRVQAEKDLHDARERAESANRAKSEFLSRVSHELRTPLNAILGFSQLLAIDASGRDLEYAQHIVRAGQHLLGLVNDVLEISGIQPGEPSVTLAPLNLNQVIDEALDLVRPLAAHHDVVIPTRTAFDKQYWVIADQIRVRQIGLNLLTNAIKYNRAGGHVRLTCEQNEGRVSLGVIDTGRGIPSEHLSRIFLPFVRLDADAGDIEGTGLGLAVCQSIAEQINAEVSVSSALGEGSAFTLEMNAAVPSESVGHNEQSLRVHSQDAGITETGPRIRILYVDDNVSNVDLMRHILAAESEAELTECMRGEPCQPLAEQLQPNLILLDLHLPDINGDVVLQRLRESPTTRHIPVVMVTADATPARVQELLALGAVDYVTKPFEITRIVDVVARLALRDAAPTGKAT